MSKRQIIVEIDPHKDGVHCGPCEGVLPPYCRWRTVVPPGHLTSPRRHDVRGPSCLAAEKRLRDLIEAGEAMAGQIEEYVGTVSETTGRWDRALAAVKDERP